MEPDLVKDVPAHNRRFGLDDPSQTKPFYDSTRIWELFFFKDASLYLLRGNSLHVIYLSTCYRCLAKLIYSKGNEIILKRISPALSCLFCDKVNWKNLIAHRLLRRRSGRITVVALSIVLSIVTANQKCKYDYLCSCINGNRRKRTKESITMPVVRESVIRASIWDIAAGEYLCLW